MEGLQKAKLKLPQTHRRQIHPKSQVTAEFSRMKLSTAQIHTHWNLLSQITAVSLHSSGKKVLQEFHNTIGISVKSQIRSITNTDARCRKGTRSQQSHIPE